MESCQGQGSNREQRGGVKSCQGSLERGEERKNNLKLFMFQN